MDSHAAGVGQLNSLFQLEHVSLQATAGSSFLLEDISLEVMPAEVIGVVGPSGAGKTSLLRLLNRLQDKTAGQLRFQGQPIEQIPILELRRQVVLVGQESNLLEMSVRDALSYPLQLRRMASRDIEQRLQVWLDRLNLPAEWLERSALELSVGQRQRVSVARGLMTQPPALLLDEPTASLDIGQAERLLSQLTYLAHDQQSTVIMANHQLEWVEQFCQRVLYLQGGQLLGDWSVTAVDWPQLRRKIAAAEQQERQEWGD